MALVHPVSDGISTLDSDTAAGGGEFNQLMERDLSLTVHFLYQCHMGFATAPPL